MAVYTHFGSMAGVVDEVVDRGLPPPHRPRRRGGHVADDPLVDLRRMAGAYRDNALENRHLFGVMFGAISLGGFHGRGADPEVAAAAFDQIVSGIERAMAAGVLREGDARAVAAQFWSALHGYVMLELAGMDRVVDDSERTVLWPMLAHLLEALAPAPR